jgi:hypothetical protein
MDATNINFIGFIFTVVMGMLMFFLPRRLAYAPLAIMGCYITLGQMVNIVGLHFTVMRIVVLFGWLRLIIRGELTPRLKLNSIDKTVICWVTVNFVAYLVSYGTWEAFVSRLGFAYNALGMYFLFRFLIRDLDDINATIKGLAIVIVPLAILMVAEASTSRNVFSIFGGVGEFSMFREDKFRAQGSFTHPIMAGTFGATLVPLFVSLWFQGGRSRAIALVGFVSATTIAAMSHSSGPLLSFLFGVIALATWVVRDHLRTIRWSLLALLVSLVVVMKAPIWYLPGKLADIFGGDGWYRSELMGSAITHFGEWWLFGTTQTSHWMEYASRITPTMIDITNEYVRQGIDGGLLTMALFVAVIVLCFRGLGRALRIVKDGPLSIRILLWSLGSALVAHLVSFFSVAYFDQLILFWFMLLAMISALSSNVSRAVAEPAE